ncbi:unnamed protein product, partial [Rotaria sp. Silwood2]
IIWTRNRKIIMCAVLIISVFTLLVQLAEIKDLHALKKKPRKETSFFITYISFTTSLIGLYAFGPPIGPTIVTALTLLIMGIVQSTYPGLILILEEIMITSIFFSLSLEFFIVGKLYGQND